MVGTCDIVRKAWLFSYTSNTVRMHLVITYDLFAAMSHNYHNKIPCIVLPKPCIPWLACSCELYHSDTYIAYCYFNHWWWSSIVQTML